MNAALRLTTHILRAELLVGAVLYALLIPFGPELLLLDDNVAGAVIRQSIDVVPPVAAFCLGITALRLRRHRFVLRALAIGSTAVEPEQLANLARVSAEVTWIWLGTAIAAVFATILPPLRPAVLDDPTATSLALLGVLIAATGALPLYVAVRAAVARALELAPPAVMVGVLELEEKTGRARRRLVSRAVLAIATPVGFIAFGAALITRAHVRQFDEHARERTALSIALGALDRVPGVFREAGRTEALSESAEHGYTARLETPRSRFGIERGNGGRTRLFAPLDDGTAVVEFRASAVAPLTLGGAGIAAVAVLLATALGLRVGRSLADDLEATTSRVRHLRTGGPVGGSLRAAPTARYAQVAALDGAIDTLAARFRVFARAQEMAIEARAAGRRMRSLLFASVSHDLRNPLNAILGFADLVSRQPLSEAQRESLGFIRQSGRELLTLIVIILDTAKVEAGRILLERTAIDLPAAIAEAVRRASTLVPDPVSVRISLANDLGRAMADHDRLVQAISLLVLHCLRTAAAAQSARGLPRPVRITGARAHRGARYGLRVADPNGTIPRADLEKLIGSEPGVAERRRYGGLTLGLSLARALIELHGGTLRVLGDPPEVEFELDLPVGDPVDSVPPPKDAISV